VDEGLHLNMTKKQTRAPERTPKKRHEVGIKIVGPKEASTNSAVVSIIDTWLARALAHQIARAPLPDGSTEGLRLCPPEPERQRILTRKKNERYSGKGPRGGY
jgi:hypothetical protein